MSNVTITVFTDPACPIALSAEPRRMRIAWLFRGQLDWQLNTVVLNEQRRQFSTTGEGFTKDRFLSVLEGLVDEHHMPISLDAARGRAEIPASIDPCRAITAASVHGRTGDDWRLLQALREQFWTNGEWLDGDAILAAAARTAGIDLTDLEAWIANPSTEDALHASMERARSPLAAARVLDHRLADASDGRRRYTCPTWELQGASGDALAVPGFVSIDAYESVLANLDPTLERRDDAQSVLEVLDWAERPLALAELAAILGTDVSSVERELAAADIEASEWVRPVREHAIA